MDKGRAPQGASSSLGRRAAPLPPGQGPHLDHTPAGAQCGRSASGASLPSHADGSPRFPKSCFQPQSRQISSPQPLNQRPPRRPRSPRCLHVLSSEGFTPPATVTGQVVPGHPLGSRGRDPQPLPRPAPGSDPGPQQTRCTNTPTDCSLQQTELGLRRPCREEWFARRLPGKCQRHLGRQGGLGGAT